MKFKSKWLYIFIPILISQVASNGQIITNFDTELSSERTDYEIELLENFIEPIDIKKLVNDPLLWKSILNEKQYLELINHLKNSGPIIDLLELQSLNSFELNDYLRLKEIIELNSRIENGNQENSIVLQNKIQTTSIRNANYNGSSFSNYQRLKLDLNNWHFGISREYDIGENSSQDFFINKYDHYNFYLNKSFGKHTISIGRYQIFHGLGVLLGQGYNRYKDITGLSSSNQNSWQSIANSTETNLFSGIHYQINKNEFDFRFGISSIKVDSGNSSGLHRTDQEIKRRKQLVQNNIILSISKSNRTSNSSILLIYDLDSGTPFLSLSKDYRFRNHIGYAELALRGINNSYCIGVNSIVNRKTQIGFCYFYKDLNFNSSWIGATVQNFSSKNSVGLNINLQLELTKKINIVFYHKLNIQPSIYNIDKSSSSGIRSTINLNKFNAINLINIRNWNSKNIEDIRTTNFRARINWNYQLTDQIEQNVSLNGAGKKKISSVGLAYQIQIKVKKLKIQYAYAQFDIRDKESIYFNLRSNINAIQSIGVFESETINSIGVNFKFLKSIQCSTLIQITSKHNELFNSYRLTINIRYQ